MRVRAERGETASDDVLPFSAISVGVARRRLAVALVTAGVPEPVRSDALLVLSELVGNAVRHARPLDDGGLRVRWRVGPDEVELVVVDGGSTTRPHAGHPPRTAQSGRGLEIVDHLAASWGVEGAGTGNQLVWAVVDRVPRR